MADIQTQPGEGASLDGALESAAGELADSILAGLTKRRWATVVCVMLWALCCRLTSS
jgi:hypothetical protein